VEVDESTVTLSARFLNTSLDQQATCYFFHNYVLEKHQYIRGNFQYLPDVYAHQKVGPGVSNIVIALGLAGLGHLWRSSDIASNAHKRYTSALWQVGTQLRDNGKAKSDQTLIAVMLLGLYEVRIKTYSQRKGEANFIQTNTCNSWQSMESWTKHVNGAAALMNIRGKNQLQTQVGHHIFAHLRSQVVSEHSPPFGFPKFDKTYLGNQLHTTARSSAFMY
jgi:hypothetical protein